jgi:hypothetical protein
MSRNTQSYLRHFQDFGDKDSLLEFIKATGRDAERYRQALRILAPVFDPLSLGLEPAYDELNLEMMEQHRPEVKNILEWMAKSSKADMQEAAAETRRRLGAN